MEKEKKFWENFKFEFKLHLNENIICQRYFNVRNYNKKTLNSLEVKETMDNITGVNVGSLGRMGIIPSYFKTRCMSQSWRYYNPYAEVQTDKTNHKNDSVAIFKFEVFHNKKLIASSQFDGTLFQPDVRSFIDIREIIPEVISELEATLSQREFTQVSTGKFNSEYTY